MTIASSPLKAFILCLWTFRLPGLELLIPQVAQG